MSHNHMICLGMAWQPVPVQSEIGDFVYVVQSLGVPLVLRQNTTQAPSEMKYRLVGPSYVHGIMDGEVKEEMISIM